VKRVVRLRVTVPVVINLGEMEYRMNGWNTAQIAEETKRLALKKLIELCLKAEPQGSVSFITELARAEVILSEEP